MTIPQLLVTFISSIVFAVLAPGHSVVPGEGDLPASEAMSLSQKRALATDDGSWDAVGLIFRSVLPLSSRIAPADAGGEQVGRRRVGGLGVEVLPDDQGAGPAHAYLPFPPVRLLSPRVRILHRERQAYPHHHRDERAFRDKTRRPGCNAFGRRRCKSQRAGGVACTEQTGESGWWYKQQVLRRDESGDATEGRACEGAWRGQKRWKMEWFEPILLLPRIDLSSRRQQAPGI